MQTYTETKRFQRLAKEYLKNDYMKYEPYGPEWEKEMMKWSKQKLIHLIRESGKRHELELEKSYSDGYQAATTEAIKEIHENYRPNDLA